MNGHVSDKNAGEGQYGPKWGIWEIPPLPPCTDLSRITANATRQEEAGPLPGFFIACAEEGGKKQGDPPTSLCPACAGPDAQDLPALWAAEAGRPPKALACAGGPGRKIARALVVLLPPAWLALFLRPLMLKVPIIPFIMVIPPSSSSLSAAGGAIPPPWELRSISAR